MRSVIFPKDADGVLALRSGVDFRDPRQVDPADKAVAFHYSKFQDCVVKPSASYAVVLVSERGDC